MLKFFKDATDKNKTFRALLKICQKHSIFFVMIF